MTVSKQEVMTPEDAEAYRKVAQQRIDNQMAAARKWRAVVHCFFIFGMVTAAAFGVILCAKTFGWEVTAVGAAFAMAASITAFVYIQAA